MPRMMNKQAAPVKVKDMKKSLGRLFRYLKSYMPLIILSVTLLIATTVFRIIGPNKLADITNILVEAVPEIGTNGEVVKFGTPFEMDAIWRIATLLICLYVFGAVFSYIANVVIARVCFKMSQKMRSLRTCPYEK